MIPSVGLMAVVELTPPVVAAVAGAALLIGISKGGLSVGGPMLTILLSLAMPATVAIGVLLPLLILGDSFALWAHWKRWDRALLLRLLPGGVAGVALASLWLRSISERALELVLVVVTVAFVAFRLVEPLLARKPITGADRGAAGADQVSADLAGGGRSSTDGAARDAAGGWARASVDRPGDTVGAGNGGANRFGYGVAAGSASGIASTVAHVGGPPIAIYLLVTRTPIRSYVATSVVYFAVINLLKVPGYVAAGLVDVDLLLRLAPTALLVPPGIALGRWAVERISQRTFDRLVLVSLLAGAALLLVR
jgi:uncharacterized membrane protein YfcA